MSIAKRTLTKWRKEALKEIDKLQKSPEGVFSNVEVKLGDLITYHDRVLLITQELLDQLLVKED